MRYRYFQPLVCIFTFFLYGFIQWRAEGKIPPAQAMPHAILTSSTNNKVLTPNQLNADSPYDWLTFIVSDKCEYEYGAELDSSQNLYVLTNRYISEDCQDRSSKDTKEMYATKIASDGSTLWVIPIETEPFSLGASVALDKQDNLYISGRSSGSWGDPLSPFSGNLNDSIFIAKYDTSNGSILWNTFLGTNTLISGITSDETNNIYVAFSQVNTRERSYFLAKLNSEGILQWSKVIISESHANEVNNPASIVVDQNGNIYVFSSHIFAWGNPGRKPSGGFDASVAKFDNTGELLWNTFLGGTGDDVGSEIRIDKEGFLYVTGRSETSWGNPINSFKQGTDIFLAKLDIGGTLIWNTFVGGETENDFVSDMEVGEDGNLYLAGWSASSWGNPTNAFSTGTDGFVAQYDPNGSLLWNSFIGGSGNEGLNSIEIDGSNSLRVTGASSENFGNPITPPQGGGNNVFVASISIPQVTQNTYRDPGPLVPILTTYIPTPLDISTDPTVIGANIFLAILLMIPFAVAVNSFSQTVSENEESLMRWIPPLARIRNMQSRSQESVKQEAIQRRGFHDLLSLFGVAIFYGIVFSLLDETWQPFTAQGLVLLGSMTFSCGIVGFLSDILQWRALRKWDIPAEYNLRATSLFLSVFSVGISRFLTLLPGLMFGSPEVLKLDEKLLSERQNQSLIKISSTTYLVMAFGAWLPTIATTLIQRGSISDTYRELIGGVEAFSLVIFAVALEGLFLELLGLSDGLGTKLKKSNRWVWGISLILCTFFFLHTLLNPRYDLIETLKHSNTNVFIGVVITFIGITFGLRLITRKQKIESVSS